MNFREVKFYINNINKYNESNKFEYRETNNNHQYNKNELREINERWSDDRSKNSNIQNSHFSSPIDGSGSTKRDPISIPTTLQANTKISTITQDISNEKACYAILKSNGKVNKENLLKLTSTNKNPDIKVMNFKS